VKCKRHSPKEIMRKLRDTACQARLPVLNGCTGALHSRLSEGFLNTERFARAREPKTLAQAWKEDYNPQLTHGAWGYRARMQLTRASAACLRSFGALQQALLEDESLIATDA
jgi:hypothetical protein